MLAAVLLWQLWLQCINWAHTFGTQNLHCKAFWYPDKKNKMCRMQWRLCCDISWKTYRSAGLAIAFFSKLTVTMQLRRVGAGGRIHHCFVPRPSEWSSSIWSALWLSCLMSGGDRRHSHCRWRPRPLSDTERLLNNGHLLEPDDPKIITSSVLPIAIAPYIKDKR